MGDVCGKAEEAISFYASVFPDADVGDILRHGPGSEPDVEGTVQYAATKAFLAMTKCDLAELERAYAGSATGEGAQA